MTVNDLRITEEIIKIKENFRNETHMDPNDPKNFDPLLTFSNKFLHKNFEERNNALMKQNKQLEAEIKKLKK